jgi:hypothetical protein
MCKHEAKYSFSLRRVFLIFVGRSCALHFSVLRSTHRDCTLRAKMDLRSIVTYLSMKDMNTREIYADMNDTLGADCIDYSTVTRYLRENVSRSRCLTQISSRKLKRKISVMKHLLGLLRNSPFPHSARLPKGYLFQWVRFAIMWQFFGVSNQEHSTRFPLTRIEPKPSTCRDELRSPSSSPVCQAPRWKYLVILDKTLFYFSNHFDRISLPHDELPQSCPKQTIASEK